MDTAARPVLRIFLSSPADVLPEREAAERLVRALAVEMADRVDLRLVRWENLERRAELGDFQAGIDLVANISQCHLVIGILWTRIGVALSQPYVDSLPWAKLEERIGPRDERLPVTGTSYEWLSAIAHTPAVEIKLFRKTARPPAIDLDEDAKVVEAAQQRTLAKMFWERLVRRDDGAFRFAHQTFTATADFARELDRELRLWLARHAQLPGEADAAVVTWRQGSPWRGLGVFGPEHAPVFFGRDRARDGIIDLLRQEEAKGTEGRTFALIVGMSGSGKSSLARAGLIPLLPTGDGEVPTAWRYAIMLPGDQAAGGDPMLALVSTLVALAFPGWRHGGADDRALAASATAAPEVLASLVSARLASQPGTRLFLLVDQFEELVTAVPVAAARAAFVRVLDLLARSGVWVVATLRGDYYQAVLEVPGLAALKSGRAVDLLSPTAAEVAEIILRPAQAAGLRFEKGADGRWLNQVIAEEFLQHGTSLPLLSFVLNRLFEADRASSTGTHGLLEFSEYAGLGRLAGGIANHVTETLAALDPTAVRRLFPALVRVPADGDAKPVRRRTPVADLPDDAAVTSVLAVLVAARLVERDGREGGHAGITLTHEILLQGPSGDRPAAWPELAIWTSEQKHLLRGRDRLATLAAEWQLAGAKDPLAAASLLLGEGLPILDAERVIAELMVDQTSRDFVAASRRQLEQRRTEQAALRRRRQRVAYLVGATGVVLAVVAGAGLVIARQQQRLAVANAALAHQNEQQATDNLGLAKTNEARANEQARLANEATGRATAKTKEANRRTEWAMGLCNDTLFNLRDRLSTALEAKEFATVFAPTVEQVLHGIRAEDMARDSLPALRLEMVCYQQQARFANDRASAARTSGDTDVAATAQTEARDLHLLALDASRRLVAGQGDEYLHHDDVCVALNSLGDDERLLGGLADADRRYAESQRRAVAMTRRWPDDDRPLRQRYIYATNGRAAVAREQADSDALLRHLRTVEAVQSALAFGAAAEPGSEITVHDAQFDLVADLVDTRFSLTRALLESGRHRDAVAVAERGLDSLKALAPRYQDGDRGQRLQSLLLTEAGAAWHQAPADDVASAAEQRALAITSFTMALAIDQGLARRRPKDPAALGDVRISAVKLAQTQAPEDLPAALATWTTAVTAARQRLALLPEDAEVAHLLATTCRDMVVALIAAGDQTTTKAAVTLTGEALVEAASRPLVANLVAAAVKNTTTEQRLVLLGGLAELPLHDNERILADSQLAFDLITVNAPTLRDPARALTLAQRAVTRSERKNADVLDTLAQVLGEIGRFDEAVTAITQAIALAAKDDEALPAYRATRTRLKAHRPLTHAAPESP